MEHYLLPDEERTFTPNLEDLAHPENENTTDEEEEEHDTDIGHVIWEDILAIIAKRHDWLNASC